MKVKTIKDEELIKAVKEELSSNPNKKFIDHVTNEPLFGHKYYFWGGIVRNPIIKTKYGKSILTKDVDILVDDSKEPINLREIFKGEKNVVISRANTIKWKPVNDFEIDVSKFSDTNKLRKGEHYSVSLKTCLKLCDFNTSAIAFDPNDDIIYSYRAIEGINKKEIDLLENAEDETHIMMVRLIIHSDKLGFNMGPRGIKFIKENYSKKSDEKIANYLDYKGLKDKTGYIIERLNKIRESP